MSISVSRSGSMSPKDQFSFDKKDQFITGSIILGTGASTSGNTGKGDYYFVKAPYDTAVFNAGVAGTTLMPYGYGILDVYSVGLNRGGVTFGGINWTKGVTFGFRAIRTVGNFADANSEFRAFIGNSYNGSNSNATTTGNGVEPTASTHQVGYKQTGTGALVFMASNGTAVTSVTTTFTPIKDEFYDVIFEVSNGVAQMFVNDVLLGTITTAPNIVTNVQAMALWLVAENKVPVLMPSTSKEHTATICDVFFAYLS